MERKIFLQARNNAKLVLRSTLANPAVGEAITASISKKSPAIWTVLLDESELPKPGASKDVGLQLSASLAKMMKVCIHIANIKKSNLKEYNALSRQFNKDFLTQYSNSVAFQVAAEYCTNQVQSGKWSPTGNDCWNALSQLASANGALQSALIDLAICNFNNPIVIFGGPTPSAQRCSWEMTAVAAANASVQAAQNHVKNMCGGWLASYTPWG